MYYLGWGIPPPLSEHLVGATAGPLGTAQAAEATCWGCKCQPSTPRRGPALSLHNPARLLPNGCPERKEHSPHDGQPGDGEHEGRFIVVNHVLGQVPEVQGPGRGTESKRGEPVHPHPPWPTAPSPQLCSADGQEDDGCHAMLQKAGAEAAGAYPSPSFHLPNSTSGTEGAGSGKVCLLGRGPRGSNGVQQTKHESSSHHGFA